MQILTPAFHFKILEDFIDVFSEQSSILASKLAVEVEKESFNIFPYVTLCTLDIVCGEFFLLLLVDLFYTAKSVNTERDKCKFD